MTVNRAYALYTGIQADTKQAEGGAPTERLAKLYKDLGVEDVATTPKAFEALRDMALKGDADALEMIINLSVVPDMEVARQALDTLMAVDRSLNTSPHARQVLRAQCSELHTIVHQKPAFAEGITVPSYVLYMAARHEEDRAVQKVNGISPAAQVIAEELVKRTSLTSIADVGKKLQKPEDQKAAQCSALVSTGRTVEEREIFGQQLRDPRVPFLKVVLPLENDTEDAIKVCADMLAAQAVEETPPVQSVDGAPGQPAKKINLLAQPRALLVNTNGHWVLGVLQRDELDSPVKCAFFDSFLDPAKPAGASTPADRMHKALKKAFGDDKVDFRSFHRNLQHVGPETEHLANACGPLVVSLLRYINESAGDGRFDAVVSNVDQYLNEFAKADRQGVILAERAAMLCAQDKPAA